jgi:hypothetical protein
LLKKPNHPGEANTTHCFMPQMRVKATADDPDNPGALANGIVVAFH